MSVALWGDPLGGPSGMSSCHLPLPMQPRHLEVEGEIGRGATERTGKELQGLTGGKPVTGRAASRQRGAGRAVEGSAGRRIPAEEKSSGSMLYRDPCSTEHGPAERGGRGEAFGCHQQGGPRQ